ncbi:exodeoxyribonuclease V subunit gamma [Acidipropionibacterium jensenii]|uniref:Exodeoxyribonuclease V subunit gamma n=1 Tax=Acidipropionibacterium jensenii TaxID=1749 RepID=A0A3T0RYV5_9ACTN|nr:exodeoxyribonuclease V subunit gamma [Acidipropionibacterium jensenii]AZZ39294.1 exodeoxyribonuclease V subunit gamma [Acidipropionibacterium jensenii]
MSTQRSATVTVVDSWEGAVREVLDALQPPADPDVDPFRLPLLVAPSQAHGRAIAQQLALRDGIAAGIGGVTPARLRTDLESLLLGLHTADDPWRGAALALRIAGVLDDVDQPWALPVRQHLTALATSGVPSPAWDLARRTAADLETVAGQWPQILTGWARGEDVDAAGRPLDPAHAWWAPLWRRLLDQDHDVPDPARRRDLLADALADPSTVLPWSRCAWLTGPSSTPADRDLAVDLGRRLGCRVIHLDTACRSVGVQTLPTTDGAWGSFNRVRAASRTAWQRRLDGQPATTGPRPGTGSGTGADSGPDSGPEEGPGASAGAGGPTTLLAALVGGSTGERPAPDGTVRIHDCHGPDRQVEVVRDVLCEAIAELPGLEPRDIVVVCPDPQVEQMLAALVCPADPAAEGAHPARSLRVQGPAHQTTNPVAEAVVRVLGLGSARAGGSGLIQLCAMPAVARRFSFSPDELAEIARLVTDAGIRWGLDAGSRARAGLPQVRQSTWLAGVERMLLGAAMSSTPPGWLATVTPVEGVGSADIDLVGRLAELISRVRRAVLDSTQPATVEQWTGRIARMVAELTASPAAGAWQGPATVGTLARLAAGPEVRLGVTEVIALLEDRVPAARPPIWFDGSTHVCGPRDLDGIAHRVVILLDPDGGGEPPDELRGLRDPGDPERDPGALARQLLFDAVASARQRLVVVRQAHDPVTNAPVLPGPFSATLDAAIDRLGVDAAAVHLDHGLQPFSLTEFDPDRQRRSFDPACAAGATASCLAAGVITVEPRIAPLLPAPASVGTGVWSPADLAGVLLNPARALLRARLGTDTRSWREEPADELPLDLGPLDSYGVRARLLADLERGASPEDARTAERLRGSTPPGRIGLDALATELDRATAIRATAQRARAAGSEQLVDVDVELSGGDLPPLSWPQGALTEPDRRLRVAGRVPVWGDAVVHASSSRASARDLLRSWIELLCVAAGRPGRWRAVLASNSQPWILAAPDPQRAADLLAGLARLAWWSTQQLVPLPLRTMAVIGGLTRGPRAEWATERSGVGVQWAREFDDDWAVFLDEDEQSLRATCLARGTTAEDLGRWLFEPVQAASGRPAVGSPGGSR